MKMIFDRFVTYYDVLGVTLNDKNQNGNTAARIATLAAIGNDLVEYERRHH
jgi:hypothetical protein